MLQLFVGSYDGTVRTLEYTEGEPPREALKVVASSTASKPNPSWITVDTKKRVLYCNSNDSATLSGCLKSFSIKEDGNLEELGSLSAPLGAAFHSLFDNREALAVPYYYSGKVGIYGVKDAGHLQELQLVAFPDFVPGSGRSQEQPRPHQAVIDPTGRYILVPDLGADLIRVFSISQEPGSLHQIKQLDGLQLRKPSFPRHIMFVALQGKTMLYVLNQDISTVLTYRAEYLPDGGLSFHQESTEIDLMQRNTRVVVRPNIPPPEHGTTASHLGISPDHRYLIVSVRKDKAFQIQSPLDPNTTITADSILSFQIDQTTGVLVLAHESHAGGEVPRHFSLNHAGDRIAITQQNNGWVSIYERDVPSGKIGALLAIKDGFGHDGPSCVKWFTPELDWC